MQISFEAAAYHDPNETTIITATCAGKDDWYMSEDGMIFDRYLLSDVFDMIRDEITPIV